MREWQYHWESRNYVFFRLSYFQWDNLTEKQNEIFHLIARQIRVMAARPRLFRFCRPKVNVRLHDPQYMASHMVDYMKPPYALNSEKFHLCLRSNRSMNDKRVNMICGVGAIAERIFKSYAPFGRVIHIGGMPDDEGMPVIPEVSSGYKVGGQGVINPFTPGFKPAGAKKAAIALPDKDAEAWSPPPKEFSISPRKNHLDSKTDAGIVFS